MTRAPFVYLHTLPPASTFETPSGQRGVLLKVNECRARVRFGSSTTRTVTKKRAGLAEDGTQQTVTFDVTCSPAEIDIAPNTEVIPCL